MIVAVVSKSLVTDNLIFSVVIGSVFDIIQVTFIFDRFDYSIFNLSFFVPCLNPFSFLLYRPHCHPVRGNTQITKNSRQVTSAVNPSRHAVWTLGSLYEHLCNWVYDFYDHQEHPALGQSPKSAYYQGIAQTGLRPNRFIPYDEAFCILTLPTTKKGTAKVIPNQGVKINHLYYWHQSFRNSSIEKTQVSVRYDPTDAGVAYAYVRGQWVRCISQY